MGALFLSQLQQFVLATGATAAVQNLAQAGALALAVTVYGTRLRPRRLLARLRARPPSADRPDDRPADPRPGPYDEHRAPVT
jgi:hypothetical protein